MIHFGQGTLWFLNWNESKTQDGFKTKSRKITRPGDSNVFNGTVITYKKDGTHSLSQKKNWEDLMSVLATN